MRKISSLLVILFVSALLQTCIRDEVLSPPEITGINPDPVLSGELVTVQGSSFDPASATLLVNGEPFSPVTKSLNEITVLVPPVVAITPASVAVRTKFGTSTALNITLLPPRPIISKVIPAAAGSGKTIKIAGRNISSITSVKFNRAGSPALNASFTIKNDTIVAVVPESITPGSADLVIAREGGQSEPAAFTILPAPSVNTVSPEKAGAGSIVRLGGANLSTVSEARIGTRPAVVEAVGATFVDVRLPSDAATDTIYVDGIGGSAKTAAKFMVIEKPVITSFSTLNAAEGEAVTITGSNLDDVFLVSFAGTNATIVAKTASSLATKVPVGAQSGKVTLTSKAGTTESAETFLVMGKPVIASFAPATGTTGTTITLTGANLTGMTSARIGTRAATIVTGSVTDRQMQIRVASSTVTGKISVTGPAGSFETTANFVITGTPQITSTDPSSGVTGTIVTIKGTNFPSNPTVSFSTGVSAVVSRSSATEIVCQVPAGAITGKITVNGALSPSDFVINARPVIQSIDPVRAAVGKDVTINGRYFTGATIKFNNNITATATSLTDTRAVVKVPAGATTGKISVTTSVGTTESDISFEVLSPPTVTSVTPASGATGSIITIAGTNLQLTSSVKFTSNVIAEIQSVSATQVIVKVPASATTGPIQVETPAGTVQTASFAVTGKPVINTITPSKGTKGELITISGANFTPSMTLVFDGQSFVVTASGNTVQVRVPVTTTFNKNVNVAVQTATDISNPSTFTLLAPPDPATLKLKPNNNPVTWPVLLEGLNLGTVSQVTIDGIVVQPDYQSSTAFTFKVPASISTGGTDKNVKVKIFYTSDKNATYSQEMNFTVLTAPPPGAFPPPIIYMPPPPPISFTPAIDADWYVPFNNDNPDYFWGNVLDIRLDTDQDGKVSGSIYGEASGSFAGNEISLTIQGEKYEGRFIRQGCMVLFNLNTGRQLALGTCDCQTPTCN